MSREPSPRPGPTVPPPDAANLASVLDRNIGALEHRRRREEQDTSTQQRIANTITRFAGSMAFVYVHLAAFSAWIVCNIGVIPGIKPWDASFVILATEASVEAIFLSTFVLISQNRASAIAEKRADLDLQINMLSEHEITRLLTLTMAMAEKMGVDVAHERPDLAELQRDVAPEAVLDEIESKKADAGLASRIGGPGGA